MFAQQTHLSYCLVQWFVFIFVCPGAIATLVYLCHDVHIGMPGCVRCSTHLHWCTCVLIYSYLHPRVPGRPLSCTLIHANILMHLHTHIHTRMPRCQACSYVLVWWYSYPHARVPGLLSCTYVLALLSACPGAKVALTCMYLYIDIHI